jgi:glycerophosphoryl diester phosphodiesterase
MAMTEVAGPSRTVLARTRPRTKIAAHRGGAALNPENSRRAFREAIRLGADQIETDVHLSSDGEPVLMHDATLDRTALASGAVGARSLAQLRAVLLRGVDEVVPHLDELLELLRPSGTDLRLELKLDDKRRPYPQLVSKVLARLRVTGMGQRCMISSFDWVSLAVVRELAPGTALIGLVKRDRFKALGGLGGVLQEAQRLGLPEVALHNEQFDGAPMQAQAAEQGLALGLYAVNSEAAMERALRLGVSAFTTDHPDLALRLRAELGL